MLILWVLLTFSKKQLIESLLNESDFTAKSCHCTERIWKKITKKNHLWMYFVWDFLYIRNDWYFFKEIFLFISNREGPSLTSFYPLYRTENQWDNPSSDLPWFQIVWEKSKETIDFALSLRSLLAVKSVLAEILAKGSVHKLRFTDFF